MSDETGKRRGGGRPEPRQVDEAFPAGAGDAPLAADALPAAPVTLAELQAGAAAMAGAPVTAELQSVADPASMLTGLLGDTSPLGQFSGVMPTFGNVLLSIGTGVAASQEAIDKSLVETVKALQDTRITVVTDVIQELGDDGLPDVNGKPTVVTEEVSLVNYVPPSHHYWKKVQLSMDMTVSGISAEHGMVFKQQQAQASGAAVSHWGFHDWFGGSATQSQHEHTAVARNEQQWTSGQVRMDAMLGARRMDKLPVGADVQIGPQILFSQGAVRETKPSGQAVTRRSTDVSVQVRKRNGAISVDQALVVSSDVFAYSLPGGQSATGTDGRMVVTLYREYPTGLPVTPVQGVLTVTMNDVVRTFEVTL